MTAPQSLLQEAISKARSIPTAPPQWHLALINTLILELQQHHDSFPEQEKTLSTPTAHPPHKKHLIENNNKKKKDEEVFSYDGSTLLCNICNVTYDNIDSGRKFAYIKGHLASKMHKMALEQKKSVVDTMTPAMPVNETITSAAQLDAV